MPLTISKFAQELRVETAFTVLSLAKQEKARGKRVVELEIGDSPFATTASAKRAGIAAIESNQTHYCPSIGLTEFREAAADFVNSNYGLSVSAENVVAGHGAKIFEVLFCEGFLDPGDGVLVFSPYFPTYLPNILRRGGHVWLAELQQESEFRPQLADVHRFLEECPRPKAIFLNSPHNPTGGVATQDDLRGIAAAIRGRNVAVFSDEPYDRMVWRGRHHTLLEEPDMLEQCVAAYTFSKSFSMSGWRVGFAVTSARIAELLAGLINTSLSCVPPITQLAAAAALRDDRVESDNMMREFERKVRLLVEGLNRVPGVHCLMPAGTFYAFANVQQVCQRLGITSHGLALYLLTAADDSFGVACLGGESFGAAGQGFVRFSCAEPDELIAEAVDFLPQAFARSDRVEAFLTAHPEFRLARPAE